MPQPLPLFIITLCICHWLPSTWCTLFPSYAPALLPQSSVATFCTCPLIIVYVPATPSPLPLSPWFHLCTCHTLLSMLWSSTSFHPYCPSFLFHTPFLSYAPVSLLSPLEGGGLDPTHPSCGEDGSQWYSGPSSDRLSDRLHRQSNETGQITARSRYGRSDRLMSCLCFCYPCGWVPTGATLQYFAYKIMP